MTVILPDVFQGIMDEIAEIVPSATVASDLVGYDETMHWIRMGESPGQEILDDKIYTTTIDFNVYSTSIEATRALAMVAYAAVRSLRNSVFSDFVITLTRTTTTPFDLTDLVNQRPRYVFSIEFTYRLR